MLKVAYSFICFCCSHFRNDDVYFLSVDSQNVLLMFVILVAVTSADEETQRQDMVLAPAKYQVNIPVTYHSTRHHGAGYGASKLYIDHTFDFQIRSISPGKYCI